MLSPEANNQVTRNKSTLTPCNIISVKECTRKRFDYPENDG